MAGAADVGGGPVPVVVTGADEPLGAAVVAALLADGVTEVRATVRQRAAVAPLVSRGVRTAVSDLVDPERLGGVLAGAHTVVHAAGPDPAATLGLLADGLAGTGVRRVVLVATAVPRGASVPLEAALVLVDPGQPLPELVAAVLAADRAR